MPPSAPELSTRNKDIARKLQEMQAREEDAPRSKPGAQRGRDARRGGRRGGRDLVAARGGARPGDPRRGLPGEEHVEFKLTAEVKEADPGSYKVCQFYLHEFQTSNPAACTS